MNSPQRGCSGLSVVVIVVPSPPVCSSLGRLLAAALGEGDHAVRAAWPPCSSLTPTTGAAPRGESTSSPWPGPASRASGPGSGMNPPLSARFRSSRTGRAAPCGKGRSSRRSARYGPQRSRRAASREPGRSRGPSPPSPSRLPAAARPLASAFRAGAARGVSARVLSHAGRSLLPCSVAYSSSFPPPVQLFDDNADVQVEILRGKRPVLGIKGAVVAGVLLDGQAMPVQQGCKLLDESF